MKSYTFREFAIPEDMMCGLLQYVNEGIPQGGFLESVLSNDLMAACSQADERNLRNLPAYAAYLYNEAPRECWGSRANYSARRQQND